MKSCKKRSRKSKLVPRECLDSDDENIADMQNEIEQTIARMTSNSILKKLSRHSEEPLQFSIKVEVEEVDEAINTQIKQEETDRELNITIDSIVSLKEPVTDIKENQLNSLLEKTSSPSAILSKGPKVSQYVLTEDIIREEFNRISKQTTSKADKLIEIHISNFLGRYCTEIELDDKELQLQSVIGNWKSWLQANPKYRNVPLSYKCYICSKAWWHYYDFRQHFHTHDQVELDIQTYGQECNVIAYQNDQPLDHDIPIDETCWRCGHDFTMHRVTKQGKKTYKCKGCLEKFISCTLLNEHTGYCAIFKKVLEAGGIKTNEVFSCTICPVKYYSDVELKKHLITRHSVRSDLPAVIHVKNCPTCNRRSISGHSRSCKLCKDNFRKADLEMNQTVVEEYPKCTICGVILITECKVLHLLTHSDTYTMVYKCKLCLNFVYFLSELLVKKHRFECHKNTYIKKKFFERIVLPKSLVENTALKTDLPETKSINNINDYQQNPENTNLCEVLEMKLLDIKENHSKNDNARENMTKSKKGETNINMDKVITKVEGVSIDIEEVTINIDVSTNIDEVLTNIDEVSTNIDEASPNMDIVLNNMESINIKKEKPDIEEVLNNEYSKGIIIKQEPMEIDFNINYYNEDDNEDTINDMVVKEEIVEHVVKICDLNSDIRVEVKDEPIDDIDYDMITDNEFKNNDDDKNDKDFKLIYTSKMYSCRKCCFKGIHRQYKEHIKGKCQNSSYTCTKCNSKHQSLKEYLSHFQQHNYVPYTCPKCFKQLPLMGNLTTHVYQHIKNNFVGVHFIKEKTSDNCYQCRQCRNNVASSDFFMHWESHIEIKNQGPGSKTIDLWEKKPILLDVIALLQGEIPEISKELQPKQCVMCLKNFSRKNDLKRHLIEHLLKDAYINRDKYKCLKCQICNIGFNKIDIYKRHMRDHGSLPLYKCEICDKTFSDSSNFSKMHDKCKPIECDCCRRVFHSPSLYRKHRNGRYRSKCAVCSVTFNSLKEKWDHMWLEHKERKYLADCPICKKSFRKYLDVKMHIRSTHDSKYVYKPVYEKINKNEEVIVLETVNNSPVVVTEAGPIRGLYSEDGSYKLFLGVLYGTVVNENPFGLSIPYPKFETIFDANDDSKKSPQIEEFNNKICGSLDCLRLNISVPKAGKDLPVFVWIHGGRFEIGSGSRYIHGPKYFMNQEVIMVTINYRLGPYGFMCLDTPEVPGNQGIRDALMALRWIKKNIQYFGGSNNITVCGHSAGAFIVELLMNLNEGLFDKAILMSGTISRPGTFKACDKTQPIIIAAKLGFQTNDSADALNFLSKCDPHLVVKAHIDSCIRFRPTKEKKFSDIEQIVKDDNKKVCKKIKMMIGNCSAESILLFYHKSDEELNKLDVFRETLNSAFKFSGEELNTAEQIVRQFYIGDEKINKNVMLGLTDFYSDFNFVFPVQRTITSFAEQGLDVYYYVFSYNGERNFIKKRNNMLYGGASHADDIAFLFDLSFESETSNGDQLIIDQMTKMWANFAKYGNPTPKPTQLLPTKWLPVTENKMYYLNINKDIKCGTKPMHKRMAFWELFYKYYNKNMI